MRLRTKLMIAAGASIAAAGIVKAVTGWRKKSEVTRHTRSADAMIGKECEITTLEVSSHFGQGIVQDGGPGMIVSIRCEEPNELARGGRARIVAYHAGSDAYSVEPV